MNKTKNKRTKKTAIAAVGMAAILAVSGIFAFMSDHDNAINKFNFTNEDGDSSIDIQLSETEWVEENGKDILYGTPVAKNPVATNIGTNDMYAFASVILPAKAVTVQNAQGQVVDLNDAAIAAADLSELGIKRTIANNVTNADKTHGGDETEILGVFKDAALTDEYEFGEEITTGSTIYFKLNETAPMGTAVDGESYKVLADTVDTDNFTSNLLGHQFMLKLENNNSGKLAIRELYALETGTGVTKDDVSGAKRNVNIAGAWKEEDGTKITGHKDVISDASAAGISTHGQQAVYGRYDYNKATADKAGWVEITDELSNATVYIDGAGRVYSAHVFYYSVPLAAGESTVPVFDAVELINLSNGQIMEEDDMNIYVETYGVQTTGLDDALSTLDEGATKAQEGKLIFDVMANSTDQNGFDIFGVVKDTQDDTVATYVANGQTVDNDYAITVTP